MVTLRKDSYHQCEIRENGICTFQTSQTISLGPILDLYWVRLSYQI